MGGAQCGASWLFAAGKEGAHARCSTSCAALRSNPSPRGKKEVELAPLVGLDAHEGDFLRYLWRLLQKE